MPVSALPPEIISLVHHVELNNARWLDNALDRFIVGAIWLARRPLALDDIANELNSRFSIRLDAQRIQSRTDSLCSSQTLVCLPNGELRVSEQALRSIETDLERANQVERAVREKFVRIIAATCPGLDPEDMWRKFAELCLLPLVGEMGARTYEMLSAVKVDLNRTLSFPRFLERYAESVRPSLQQAILSFLDASDSNVRTYVLFHLNACFLLVASSLPGQTLSALGRAAGWRPSFKILVDTNFLFSLLGLHENPANNAAVALVDLVRRLPETVSVKFYVCVPTLDEMKFVIDHYRDVLKSVRLTPNLTDALTRGRLSGIAMKFVDECRRTGKALSSEEYFGPYATGLLRIVRDQGIELYNEDLGPWKKKQEVIDDVLRVREEEQKRYGERAKTYERLMHDIVLWHFASSKRPVRVESPVDAEYWIVTVDSRFRRFDENKREGRAGEVPVCVHPAMLVQMLQFWVPRTREFEEAVVASLRYPFLFFEFDSKAERTTIRILETLARFENVQDLTTETVSRLLMDDALRQKIGAVQSDEARMELIRERLIEENARAQAVLERAERRAKELAAEVQQKGEAVREAQEALREERGALERITLERDREGAQAAELGRRVRELEGTLDRGRLHREERRARRAFAWGCGGGGGVAVALVSAILAVILAQVTRGIGADRRVYWSALVACVTVTVMLWGRWVERVGRRSEGIEAWSVFRTFRQWKRKLTYALSVIVLGALGNAVWEWSRQLWR